MEHPLDGNSASIDLTAGVVAAYISNNPVRAGDLPELIEAVHSALKGLGSPSPTAEVAKPTPAVSVKKSLTPDYLISLEDGKSYKSLKRHLTGRGLTPDEYRMKWGLPSNYPMVAPNYAKQRSELAKTIGLGRKRQPEPAAVAEPKRRGRKKAA